MRLSNKLSIALGFVLPLCAAQSLWAQQTKILSAEKHNEYGLVYTLPITAFEIEVTAIKETSVAGPYYKYSKMITGNEKAIAEDKIVWTIADVKVRPYGIPDPEARYLMQLKAGSTTYIGVADDGMLLSINREPSLPTQVSLPSNRIEGSPVTGKEYLDFVNEDYTSAQSSFKKAQVLGEELMEIREARLSLTRGTAETMPTDGKQLEIMLASLEDQENAITKAFTGSSWKEYVTRTYTFTPEQEVREILFRLSDFKGLVDSDDYSGDPVYINISLIQDAVLPTDSKGEEKKLPKDAVMYCVPGVADLTISLNGKNLFSKEFEMSQFGLVYGLNPSLFTDKKSPSYAIFDPATGALKELGDLK